MTAQERRAQYNSITEKYVNTAVKDQDYQQPPSTEVKPLEVVAGTEGEEAKLVSHTEMMREHYSTGDQLVTTASQAENAGRAHWLDQTQHQAHSVAQHQQSPGETTNTRGQERTVTVVKEELGGLAEEEEVGKVRKKYIITQQEIVFYIKNADGKIHIVHRPLITGEKIYGSLRKRNASQPNLTDIDKLDSPGAGLAHIRDVGNINLNPGDIKHPEHQELLQQDNQWTSSGSIFDCNQGCFSDQTVII